MKYYFEGKNIKVTFHAFPEIEGQKAKYMEGFSIVNILCDFYEKDTVKQLMGEVTYGDADRYASIISTIYDSLPMEDCMPKGNLYHLEDEDIDIFFEISINGNKITTQAVWLDYPRIHRETYVSKIL